MSWLDDALARDALNGAKRPASDTDQLTNRDQEISRQVGVLDSFIQQILGEFGERVMGPGRAFRGRQYSTRLEAPGQRHRNLRGEVEQWGWHWHLYSYARDIPGIELHPDFDETGIIIALSLHCGTWSATCAPDEDALKAILVQCFQANYAK